MQQIAIWKFKATCLAVLERVRQTGEPVLVTRFGKPVAMICAAGTGRRRKGEAGRLAHTGRILGDIVAPISAEEDWEALRREPAGARGKRAQTHAHGR
jgi:antitoxin (DNA-binding transcriptional repressor) of toxin-antitoxin stability system